MKEQFEFSEDIEKRNMEQIEEISFLYNPGPREIVENNKVRSNQKKAKDKKRKEIDLMPERKVSLRKRTPERLHEDDKIKERKKYQSKINNEVLNNSYFFIEQVIFPSKKSLFLLELW